MKTILPLLLCVAGCLCAQNMAPEPERRLLREIYKELIESNTSYTTGKTTPAAEAIAKRFRAAGFAEGDIAVLGAAPHKHNVIVRFRGTGAKKPILLLAHLDVVEARREDWTMDPFQLNEKDGYFYGRGTLDDKAQAAHWIANLLRYKRENWKPSRDLILALTADEEGWGPYNGVDWLLKNRRALIDAEYCLNEGGWGEMNQGRKTLNLVQVAEKTFGNFRLEVKNPGGHSSMPVKENAIYRLSSALQRVSELEFPAKLNNITRSHFERLANQYTGETASDLRKTAGGDAAAIARISAASPNWNALLRTTCVATMLEAGHAVNALPQTARAIVNCRILPDETVDSVVSALKKAIKDEQVTISVHGDPATASPVSELRDDVGKAIRGITEAMWPGVPTQPMMVMGGTDGKFLRALGIPTFGITGLFLERDDFRAHGQNERVGVKEFYEAQEFLYRLVKELAR
jgi:acetylornithine deacetylase/succinyl-diaminopimelate desuccinylase-like protein